MSKISVIILKNHTKKCDYNIEKLSDLFSDDIFDVKIHFCINYNEQQNILSNEEYNDNMNYLKVLKSIKKNQPFIIIYDNSISYLSKNKIKYLIEHALSLSDKADLYFLCNWKDDCHKHTCVNHSIDLKWSSNANAHQAILYQPNIKDIIIKELKKNQYNINTILQYQIQNNNIKAMVFTQNLIDFDINLAKSNEDYYKLNRCNYIPIEEKTLNNSNNVAWIFIVIIIIILLIIIVPYFKYNKKFN